MKKGYVEKTLTEDEESRISELQEYKGRNKWYEHRKGICAEVYGNHHLWE